MPASLMSRLGVTAAAGLGPAALVVAAGAPSASAGPGHGPRTEHVLLLSVDGLHQSDLAWYVAHHPDSSLAALTRIGTSFTHARTPFPSDSFPGMVGQVTGGNPRTTGSYYDVSIRAPAPTPPPH